MNRLKFVDFGASIGIFLAYTGNYIYFPLLIAKLGAEYNGFLAGLVIFMTYVGRLSATFFYTYVSKKISIRNIISLFVLFEGLALFGMGWTSLPSVYMVLAYFIGFASGMSFPALKHALSILPETIRLPAFSRFQLASQAGLIAGAVIGGLCAHFSMILIFSTTFILFLGYSLVAFLFIPNSGEYQPVTTLEKIALIDMSLIRNRNFPAIKYDLVMSTLYWLLIMSFMVNIPLTISAYLPTLNVSMPFWLTGCVLLFLQMPLIKYAKTKLSAPAIMMVGSSALLIGFIAFSLHFSLGYIVIGSIMMALGQILFAPALDLLVSQSVVKENMGKAMGAMHFYRSLGNLIGALFAGILFDLGKKLHFSELSWLFLVVIAVILTLAALRLWKIKSVAFRNSSALIS
ncbi:MAG: hypothetical protein A3E82_01010 [Gammaproteobacteria bacterium RIFCSPHIGHO2_12_FULL_38_11]|nr:MAG: hypothetical protein A3E82_01010 [Gammaproteobacteria bacterium RIFCSPHIGHO2_12_FULL_38_11]